MRKVEQIMGMPITVDIPGCKNSRIFEEIFARFHEIDDRFSSYKKDSELSKYQRGEIKHENLSVEFKKMMESCKKMSQETDGYFSAYYGGKFDPTGYVKGYAISQAGKIIEKEGFKTYCIGAGGDILARSDSDKIWNIGLQDPKDPKEILNMLSIKNGAVATSGNYERGKHIIDPHTGEPADELLSISVVGPKIITADVLATAVFSEGLSGIIQVEEKEGYEALAVDKRGDWYVTSSMQSFLKIA